MLPALVLVLVAAGAAGWTLYDRRRFLVHRRVVVNLRNGKALEGILVDRRGDLLVLKASRLHEPGAAPVAVDGDVVVERRNIDFVQALTTPEEG